MNDLTAMVTGIDVFAGIRPRLYSQDILKNFDWYQIQPSYVHFHELWLTQDKLRIAPLFGQGGYSTDPHPRIVAWHGSLFLEDGHHRVIKRALQGELKIAGRIYIANG